MKHIVVASCVLLLIASAPAMAQKVYVDYDRFADLGSFKTFAWVDTNTTSLKMDYPEVDDMIENNVKYYLIKRGMKEVADDPDVCVTYHTSTSTQTQFMTSSFGYGFGSGWTWGPYWGPMMASGTMTTDFKKGTLVIDVWNPHTKEAVFRGTATESIGDDPFKTVKKIDKAIDKIVEEFRKMRSKEATKQN